MSTHSNHVHAPSQAANAQRALRDAFGAFATGIAIITTLDEHGSPAGLTVNSFSSVSLDPPLVAWSLRNASPLVRCFTAGRSQSIHILRDDQEHLARHFARSSTERFATIAWQPGYGGVPRLENVLVRLDCRTESVLEAGDHRLLLARVESHVSAAGAPLLFAGGRFRTLGDVQSADPDPYSEGVWL